MYPVRVNLLLFVGGLENNAFTFFDHGNTVVALPVEMADEKIALTLSHEFTHAVQQKILMHLSRPLPGENVRPDVGNLIFTEGLAMGVSKKLFPGLSPEQYTNTQYPGWLGESFQKQSQIFLGLLKNLEDTSTSGISRFTFGLGTVGIPREGYFAGWIIIGRLEEMGFEFSELARMDSTAVNEFLKFALLSILQPNAFRRAI
jgi:hypothetical protein